MRSLEELGQLDRANRIGDFASFCRHLMLGRGSTANALAMAKGQRASPRVVEALEKAAVLPMGGGGAGTGAEALTSPILRAFVESLKFNSAFAAASAASLFIKTPLGDSVGLVLSGASAASEIDRGGAIPVHKVDVANQTVARRKVAGMVVVSNELLRQSAQAAESLITTELRGSIGHGLDDAFVADLTSGLTPHTSQGPLADAATLMADVGLRANSRPFWICGPQAAAILATSNIGNVRAAPDVNPTSGGSLLGWPLFITAALDYELVLADGSKFAGNLAEVEISYSAQAAIEADDAPAGGLAGSPSTLTALGTTSLISLWQENCSGLKAVQYFGFQVLRSGAASVVSYAGSP
jgi:Phage capsid family